MLEKLEKTEVPLFNAEGYEVGYYHEVTVIPCWTQEYGWDIAQITVVGISGISKKYFPLTGEDFSRVRHWLLLFCYNDLAEAAEKGSTSDDSRLRDFPSGSTSIDPLCKKSNIC